MKKTGEAQEKQGDKASFWSMKQRSYISQAHL